MKWQTLYRGIRFYVAVQAPPFRLPSPPSHQVWLIEVNVNPAMHTNCDTFKALVPGVIEETLGKTAWSVTLISIE